MILDSVHNRERPSLNDADQKIGVSYRGTTALRTVVQREYYRGAARKPTHSSD